MSGACGFTRHLALLYLFGAARADATPEQVYGLEDLVDDLRGSRPLGEIARGVLSVMGPDWRPTGEWEAAMRALLDDGEPSP